MCVIFFFAFLRCFALFAIYINFVFAIYIFFLVFCDVCFFNLCDVFFRLCAVFLFCFSDVSFFFASFFFSGYMQ